MEKWNIKVIVYNAEPFEYSTKAIETWRTKGFVYKAGSWKEIAKESVFPKVSILIVRLGGLVNTEVLRKFPDLIYLISATTGHDHLDTQTIEKRGIKLVTLRGHDDFLRTIPSTAEHTWALLLALSKKITQAYDHVCRGNWNRDLFRGYQLHNKHIGLIGLGRIGSVVARYAHCFGMKVQYYDPVVNDTCYNKMSNLEELVYSSDIVSVHVHLTPETEGLISTSLLQNFKPGALLINTSRGAILDEKAVVEALNLKSLGGVAVDVLATELSDIQESPLWLARNKFPILITPHIGGASYDAMWSCEEYIQNFVDDLC